MFPSLYLNYNGGRKSLVDTDEETSGHTEIVTLFGLTNSTPTGKKM